MSDLNGDRKLDDHQQQTLLFATLAISFWIPAAGHHRLSDHIKSFGTGVINALKAFVSTLYLVIIVIIMSDTE